jgi:hypothetical protein
VPVHFRCIGYLVINLPYEPRLELVVVDGRSAEDFIIINYCGKTVESLKSSASKDFCQIQNYQPFGYEREANPPWNASCRFGLKNPVRFDPGSSAI